MKKLINITKDVEFSAYDGGNDGECLPITKCKCGKKFEGWDFIISIYDDTKDCCPNCGRILIFKNEIKIYEVLDKNIKKNIKR